MRYMDPLLSVTILLGILAIFIFLVWYFNHKAKSKERLLLIEKGVDIQEFLQNQNPSNTFLKISVVIIGLGFAFGLQAILLRIGVNDEPLYLAVLFLCGGVSLFIVQRINRKKK